MIKNVYYKHLIESFLRFLIVTMIQIVFCEYIQQAMKMQTVSASLITKFNPTIFPILSANSMQAKLNRKDLGSTI